jgi:CRP-like cAMP-binding protein
VQMSQENEQAAEMSRIDAARRENALDDIALFARLPVEERRELASTARWSPFGKGEVLTRQGAEANWLYVVVSGECSVRVQVEGDEKEVARLHPGEFFGEMSLLTGAPRSATVVAESEVTCWRLEREAFRQLIARRPEIAEEVAEVIATRQEELDDVREDLSLAAKAKRKAARTRDLAGSIRSFLGLDADAGNGR